MTPEEKARQKIDQWFSDAGWKVVNRDNYEPNCTAVAIREGLLKDNLEADYFLFINGKAVGVLEAKREEIDPFSNNVCEQAVLYARNVPNIYQVYQKPLPFIFTSNGKDLYFCDFRKQDSCFKQIIYSILRDGSIFFLYLLQSCLRIIRASFSNSLQLALDCFASILFYKPISHCILVHLDKWSNDMLNFYIVNLISP